MPWNYQKVSCYTGNSVNTAFSAIITALPAVYHVAVQNNTSFVVCGSLATSAPTSTTTDQFFVPASGYAWFDCIPGETLAGNGTNFYLRTDESGIVSGAVRVTFK